METTKESLISMGFPSELVDRSLSATNGSIEQAIDWIEKVQSGEIDLDAAESAEGDATDPAAGSETEPKAGPVGTVEERLAVLQARAAERKAAKLKEDAIERRRNEQILKKSQETTRQAYRELEVKQAQKAADERKRAALEDRKHREKLRLQIEQDKKERAARAAGTSAGASAGAGASAVAQPPKPAAPAAVPTGDVRLRIRYTTQTLTKSYPPSTTVEELGKALASELAIHDDFVLVTSYPKQQISPVGNTATLREAGLANASITIEMT